MKLSLYRVYDNTNVRKFLFSEDAKNIDAFTLKYKNNNEMLEYFNCMTKVYNEDGTVNNGRFATFINAECIDAPIESKIYFEEDVYFIVEKLLNYNELLTLVINEYIDFFDEIWPITLVQKYNLSDSVSKYHIDALIDSIKRGYISIRRLDEIIEEYENIVGNQLKKIKTEKY